MKKKQPIDRAAIMRRAHALRREQHLDLSTAMKTAWAEAKGGDATSQGIQLTPNPYEDAAPRQASGVRAAFRRYGIDFDRIPDRAKAFVARLQSELHDAVLRRQARLADLRGPSHAGPAIDATRNEEGTYSA